MPPAGLVDRVRVLRVPTHPSFRASFRAPDMGVRQYEIGPWGN